VAQAKVLEKDTELFHLREALKPFAAIAEEYSEYEDDDHQVWKDFDIIGSNLPLKIFRAAEVLLKAKL